MQIVKTLCPLVEEEETAGSTVCSCRFSSGSPVAKMAIRALAASVWDPGIYSTHLLRTLCFRGALSTSEWVGQGAHAHIHERIQQELLSYNQSQVNFHCENSWKQVARAAWRLYLTCFFTVFFMSFKSSWLDSSRRRLLALETASAGLYGLSPSVRLRLSWGFGWLFLF